MQLTPDIALFIVIHAIKSKKYMQLVANKIKLSDFDSQLEYGPKLIWAVAHEYWKLKNECIPIALLKMAVNQQVIDDGIADNNDLIIINNTINTIVSYPDSAIDVDYMVQHTARFLQVRRAGSKITLLQYGDVPSVLSEIEKLHREISLSSVGPCDMQNLNVDTLFNQSPRQSTGVTVIDELLSGGVLGGEVYGFLGPVGGGKSTTSYSLIAASARRKRHVALFSYEEGGDSVKRRIIISNAGVNRTLVDSKLSVDIPQDIKIKLSNSINEIGPYVHYFDMTTPTSGRGGAAEMVTLVQNLVDDGRKPELICVDWIGEMAAKYLQAMNKDADTMALRSAINRQIAGISELAEKFKIPIFAFHQLNKDKCTKAAKIPPTWVDSQDARSFADLLHYCLCLGVGHQVHYSDRSVMIAWLNLSKARGLVPKKAIVEIDGAYCRIRKPSKEYVVSQFGTGFDLAEDKLKSFSISEV